MQSYLFYIPWRKKKKKKTSYLKLLKPFFQILKQNQMIFDENIVFYFYHVIKLKPFFKNKSQYKKHHVYKETRHLAKKKKNAKVCLVITP